MRGLSKQNSATSPMTQVNNVGKIFDMLAAIYGAKFTRHWINSKPEVMQDMWSAGLAGFSAEEVERGLKSCITRSDEWPPTLPEFRNLCRPNLDPETSYREAVKQIQQRKLGNDAWSSPVVYWTAVAVGEHELLHSSWQSIKSQWISELSKKLANKDKLGPIPKPMLQISHGKINRGDYAIEQLRVIKSVLRSKSMR